MGEIKRVVIEREVPAPMFNDSLRVELCENVHIHYRNIRLEFGKEEFLLFREAMLRAIPEKVESFPYGQEHLLLVTARLPEQCEFDKRMRVEEQVDGSFHVHYRNLRGEFRSLAEAGVNL